MFLLGHKDLDQGGTPTPLKSWFFFSPSACSVLCCVPPEVFEKGGDGGEEKAVVPLGFSRGDLVQQLLHGERFGYTTTLEVLNTNMGHLFSEQEL